MIVISGASGGIGSALIPDLVRLDPVLGLYHRTRPGVAPDPRVELESVDLRDKGAITDWVAGRRPSLSRVTLIHCATVSIDGLLAQCSEEAWDHAMDVNLKGVFLLTQALLPVMMVERWGRIIHLSSVVAEEGEAGAVAYGASKAGLWGFSRGVAKEYARFNVTSNVLQLGFFESGLGRRLPEERRAKIIERIPSRKFGAVADIAAAVEFVMRCDYLTGSTIRIDGAI
jgi:NAD(P)-dependent dehydrogenase (short-subunit alcohol dehydrogenase family)